MAVTLNENYIVVCTETKGFYEVTVLQRFSGMPENTVKIEKMYNEHAEEIGIYENISLEIIGDYVYFNQFSDEDNGFVGRFKLQGSEIELSKTYNEKQW